MVAPLGLLTMFSRSVLYICMLYIYLQCLQWIPAALVSYDGAGTCRKKCTMCLGLEEKMEKMFFVLFVLVRIFSCVCKAGYGVSSVCVEVGMALIMFVRLGTMCNFFALYT